MLFIMHIFPSFYTYLLASLCVGVCIFCHDVFLSVSMLLLGKKLTSQEDHKHFLTLFGQIHFITATVHLVSEVPKITKHDIYYIKQLETIYKYVPHALRSPLAYHSWPHC